MTTTHFLRLGGIILTVTGVIASVHYYLRTNDRLPDIMRNNTLTPHAELIVATAMVVVGVPLLLVARRIG